MLGQMPEERSSTQSERPEASLRVHTSSVALPRRAANASIADRLTSGVPLRAGGFDVAVDHPTVSRPGPRRPAATRASIAKAYAPSAGPRNAASIEAELDRLSLEEIKARLAHGVWRGEKREYVAALCRSKRAGEV